MKNTELRKRLCYIPIIHNDGSVNQKYFAVKPGEYWTEDKQKRLENKLIRTGTTKLGVEEELKASIMLASYDLEKY